MSEQRNHLALPASPEPPATTNLLPLQPANHTCKPHPACARNPPSHIRDLTSTGSLLTLKARLRPLQGALLESYVLVCKRGSVAGEIRSWPRYTEGRERLKKTQALPGFSPVPSPGGLTAPGSVLGKGSSCGNRMQRTFQGPAEGASHCPGGAPGSIHSHVPSMTSSNSVLSPMVGQLSSRN